MTRKQIALLLAPIVAAISAALYKCADETPIRQGGTAVDAGAP